jgi:hypothetical protein
MNRGRSYLRNILLEMRKKIILIRGNMQGKNDVAIYIQKCFQEVVKK